MSTTEIPAASRAPHRSPQRAARVEAGLALVRAAGVIAKGYFDGDGVTVERKDDGSPVTVADREIEETLRSAIHGQFPGDGFLGEEFPETIGDGRWRWIVDPIDGTKSFVHGVPLYANLIALEEDGEIVFGAVNLPSLDILVHAETGGGCWRNGRRVQVSSQTTLEGAYVMATWLEDWEPAVIGDLHGHGVVLRTWGDAFGYVLVACGDAEGVVDYTAQPFDLAPMPVIIGEAGGRFSSLTGASSFTAGHAIATNGHLHTDILSIVAQGDQS